jgi:hypothetical protein
MSLAEISGMTRSSTATLPEEDLLDGISRRLRRVCAHMSTVDFAQLVRAVAMVKIKYAAFDDPEELQQGETTVEIERTTR